MQESVDVRGGQNRCAGWHAEPGNPVAKVDVSVDHFLEHAFDEGVDRLTCLGGERGHLLPQMIIIELDADRDDRKDSGRIRRGLRNSSYATPTPSSVAHGGGLLPNTRPLARRPQRRSWRPTNTAVKRGVRKHTSPQRPCARPRAGRHLSLVVWASGGRNVVVSGI